MLDQLLAEEISLVDTEHKRLVPGNFLDVLLKVLGEEEVGVARIDDL